MPAQRLSIISNNINSGLFALSTNHPK